MTSGDGKLGTFASLGLGGVVATQLWHHLYLGGGLCELPQVEHQRVGEALRSGTRRGLIELTSAISV